MRILYLLPYVPSLIRVRPYHFTRELARRHEVTVIAPGSSDELDATDLRSLCRRVEVVPMRLSQSLKGCTRAAFVGEPLQAGFCRSTQLTRAVKDALARDQFDVVHVEHLRAAHLQSMISDEIPTVFDAVDCISLLQHRTLHSSHSLRQRGLAALELERTRRYEAHLLRRFDRVVATSADDARALTALEPGARVDVVPNGVDLSYFQPLKLPPDPATIVFSGKMSYHANVSAVLYFAREVLPLVRSIRPDVQLRVVGSRPPREVQQLASDPGITVTGHVADIRHAVGSATVAVSPLVVKVGIQNKVLEAMALGVPVVANRLGAEGLEAQPGKHFLVGNTPRELADNILRVLRQPALRQRLARAGREFVEAHHHWSSAAASLEAVYREVTSQRGLVEHVAS